MAITDHSGAGRWGPDDSINRQLHDLVVPQLFVLSTGLAALQRRAVAPANESLVEDLAEVAGKLEGRFKAEASSTNLIWKPSNTVPVEGEAADTLFKLLEVLEDLDDVQNVYTNVDIPDEVLAAL